MLFSDGSSFAKNYFTSSQRNFFDIFTRESVPTFLDVLVYIVLIITATLIVFCLVNCHEHRLSILTHLSLFLSSLCSCSSS